MTEIGRDIRIGFGSGGRWFAFDEQSEAGNKSETACMHSRGLQFQTFFFVVQKLVIAFHLKPEET